ncbi:MAG: PKD domain-containing protein [Bacteroidetes bacterium]|nr:PKD domain-containing protein [Bacteroidota bacterium]
MVLNLKYKLLFTFTLLSLSMWSTHIVGGEIYYDYLGNNNYNITLKVYRDCINGQAPFDNPASVGIFDASGVLITTLSIPFPGSTLLSSNFNNPCYQTPTNICVEEAVYVGFIQLPPIAGGYYLAYQRCCRNNTILNLVNPGNVGSTYWTYIPDQSVATTNNSPRFINYPPIFLCAGLPITFDHSANDPDGDSLVYELCDPYDGGTTLNPMPVPPSGPPYTAVPFNTTSGYNGSYPMASNPALSINPSTGLMTGTPNTIGQWVVGVCVKEYRNGNLINIHKRDFQFNVMNCPNNTVASIPSQQTFCTGFNVNFLNNSINGFSYHWDFGEAALTNDTSNIVAPTWTYPAAGTYTVMLVVNPGYSCVDTAYSVFNIQPLLSPSFTAPTGQCLNTSNFSFAAGGTFSGPITNFSWNFGQGAAPPNSNQQNPSGISYSTPGTKTVTLSVSENGCTKTSVQTITVHPMPTASVPAQQSFCGGLSVTYTNASLNANSFFWNFGDPTTSQDTSSQSSPTYTFSAPGNYTITLIAATGFGCKDTAYTTYDIQPLLQPSFIKPSGQCITNNNFSFTASGFSGPGTLFTWDFENGASINTSNQQNVTNVNYGAAGIYAVTLTISENGCTKYYIDSVEVFPLPTAQFNFSPMVVCNPYTILFADTTNATGSVASYNWTFHDGTTSSSPTTSFSYTNVGLFSFTVQLTAIDNNGCTQTFTFPKNNSITVNPSPTAGISISETATSIFDPEVTVTDLSINGVNCYLHFGDGTIDSTCNFNNISHSYTTPGTYTIQQILINGIGCSDTFALAFEVLPEFRFFVPNAFTYNNDQLNETFLPKVIGASDYTFRIFNRWGQLIFETHNTQEGWNGEYKTNKCQTGVYIYQITFTDDVEQKEHTFVGHVTLLR